MKKKYGPNESHGMNSYKSNQYKNGSGYIKDNG
jgi:hypothetical protein